MINDVGRRRSMSQRRERIDKWGRLGGIRADESCCALRNDWQLIMKIQEGSPTCSAKLLSLLFSFHLSHSMRTLMSTNTEVFNCLNDTAPTTAPFFLLPCYVDRERLQKTSLSSGCSLNKYDYKVVNDIDFFIRLSTVMFIMPFNALKQFCSPYFSFM